MSDEWRKDPGWRVATYDATVYPNGPPAQPVEGAELAQPPTWATEYRRNVPVATWARLDPRLAP